MIAVSSKGVQAWQRSYLKITKFDQAFVHI